MYDQKPKPSAQTKNTRAQMNTTASPMFAYHKSTVKHRNNNTGLPHHLKSGIENLSGYSMDDVKVHFNSPKPAQVQAHAYAQGTDIYLGTGQERHLPHEAWHVVQQKQGRVNYTRQLKDKAKVNDDAGLEKEADIMGQRALNYLYPANMSLKDNVGFAPVIQRVIDVNEIASLELEQVRDRIKNPNEGEERGEIAITWLTAKGFTGLDLLEQWIYLMKISQGMGSIVKETESEKPVRNKDLWLGQAKNLILEHPEISLIKPEKIALILMIYRQGIFNALGQGGNTHYIRSAANTAIKLTVGKFSAEQNKKGELPDIYGGISPAEWLAVINALGKSPVPLTSATSVSTSSYIEKQRYISGHIKGVFENLTAGAREQRASMKLIFNNSYPGLNIHFPTLKHHIERYQKKVEERQGRGMTKFLMARLIYLFNAEVKQLDVSKLAEKSSFGFRSPTLDELGDNMTIRLSPGINNAIIEPMANALYRLCAELVNLMKDQNGATIGKLSITDDMYKYWGNDEQRLDSYNREKTKLDHLLFTKVERGVLGNTIIGRMFDRNPDNLLFVATENLHLMDWATIILMLHSPEQLAMSLNEKKDTLHALQLLADGDERKYSDITSEDSEAQFRLALFNAVAKELEHDPNKAESYEYASDSDDESEVGGNLIVSGKVVVPSGMAALSQLLGEDAEENDQRIKQRMIPGVYYEFNKHKNRALNIPHYTASDTVLLDLNPNVVTMDANLSSEADLDRILTRLGTASVKVWIVDLTSSTTAEQSRLHTTWLNNNSAELLITIVSSIKHQEAGLNSNPHGLIHWSYKYDQRRLNIVEHTEIDVFRGEEALNDFMDVCRSALTGAYYEETPKKDAIKGFFDSLRTSDINKRSKISNIIRRLLKFYGQSYSWARLRNLEASMDDIE